MPWPLSQDYNEAIQSPAANFADPDLRSGEAATNPLGLPVPFSGTFADVYQVRCPDGSRWAVKCFTREVRGLRDRYQEISRHLRHARLPFTVDFTYLDQGIRVAGRWYAVLKMQWVEGLTLNQFVAKHLDRPAMLEALLQVWLRTARALRAARVGHCDLQHGNVLLVPGGSANSLALKLVDYDGMWVPALDGTDSGEVGHGNYQHPRRLRDGTYSFEVDRFPLLLIATALRAVKAGGKTLWERYDNGDNMLFRQQDLERPDDSALFSELQTLADPTDRHCVGRLIEAASRPLEQTPLLDEVFAAPTRIKATPTAAPFAPPPGDEFSDLVAPATASPRPARRSQPTRGAVSGKLWVGVAAAAGLCFALCAGTAGAIFLASRGGPTQMAQASTPTIPAPTPPTPPTTPTTPQTNPKPEPPPEPKPAPQPEPVPEPKPEPKPPVNPPLPQDAGPARLQAPFTAAEARKAQQEWAKHLGRAVEEEVDLGGGVKLALALVPPGRFLMGSPPDEKDRGQGEKSFDAEKQHPVTITKPFYLGKYPVTQEQYEKVIGKNPSHFRPDGPGKLYVQGLDTRQFPVETVTWEDADAFCQAAGKKVAWGRMALPSEAQWEYACRAGTTTPFWFGAACDGTQDNCDGSKPYGADRPGPSLKRPCAVGGDRDRPYKPNPFGLFDLHGNVKQWCGDNYGPYDGLPEVDPVQATREERRVARGGAYIGYCKHGRAATRTLALRDPASPLVGFRVCVALDHGPVGGQPPPPAARGGMLVAIDPPDATVFVDGIRVETQSPGNGGPIRVDVTPGKSHELKVTKDGFEDYVTRFIAPQGPVAPLPVKLVRRKP